MRPLAVAAFFLAAASPARATDPRPADAPRSGNFCGADPERRLIAVFNRVMAASGLEWDGTRGLDPVGREIRFIYDGTRRMVSYDCAAQRPIDGPSIGNTILCGDRNQLVLVFGVGVCEAARNEGEAASISAHEIAHMILNHTGAQVDFNDRTFQSWSASRLGRAELRGARRELGPGASQAALEDRVWERFFTQSQPVRQRFQREQEVAADQEGINLLGLAGFGLAAAADMMRHAADVRAASHLDPSARHPPPSVRESMLRSLAAEIEGAPRR